MQSQKKHRKPPTNKVNTAEYARSLIQTIGPEEAMSVATTHLSYAKKVAACSPEEFKSIAPMFTRKELQKGANQWEGILQIINKLVNNMTTARAKAIARKKGETNESRTSTVRTQGTTGPNNRS